MLEFKRGKVILFFCSYCPFRVVSWYSLGKNNLDNEDIITE